MSARHAAGVVRAAGPDSGAFVASDAVLAGDATLVGDAALVSGGALAVVAFWGAVAALLYGRLLAGQADSEAPAKLARARRVGAVLAYLVALAAMVATGWLGVLNEAVDSLPEGLSGLGGTAATIAALLAPTVASLGVVAGTLPATRALCDRDAVGQLLRRTGGALLGVAAAATALVLGVTAANPDVATGLGWVGTSVILGLLLAAGSPLVARLFDSVREPTAAERERLERCCDAVGLGVVAVRVVEADADDSVTTTVRGLPGRRHLFVGDRLLAELDDDHLQACLALQAARSRRLHPEARALAVLAPLVVAGAFVDERLVLPGVPPVAGAVAVLAVGLVGLWAGQRLVYRADADAVGRTSRDAVLETLKTAAAIGASPTLGRIAALRRMEPPLARRVDRLRTPERDTAAADDD